MEILVCIKQVPGTAKVEVDEKTGILKRDGVESKMNPYDLYALETAIRIKENLGGNITVVTMGPPQAKSIIKEAFMMGADCGYIFSDRKFAGSDVLATSYTLSQGIKTIGSFDLILCGKQTTDGDTSQVGPAIAEYVDIPHVAWVSNIVEIDERKIVVEQDMADSTEVAEILYPCLITVEKGIYQPRLPSYNRKMLTTDRPIHVLSFTDFPDQEEKNYGISGSATHVERIFPPESNNSHEIWEGEADELSSSIYDKIKKLKFV